MESNREKLLSLLIRDGKVVFNLLKRKDTKIFLDKIDIPGFSSNAEKAYAILNELSERPKCLTCGSLTNFSRVSSGYFKFCGASCASKATIKRGKQHHFSSEETKKKIQETNLKKYGVKTPLQIGEIHAAGVEASKSVNYPRGLNFTSSDFIEKRRSLVAEGKYHSQLESVKQKIKQSRVPTYVERTLQPKLDRLRSDGYNLLDDPLEFSRFGENEWRHSCGEIFLSHPNCRFDVFCPKCKKSGISLPHQKLMIALDQLGIEYLVNDRKQIAPKELDIFFPSKNVAIEVNGIFHHDTRSVPKFYHADKTKMAKEKGIRLLHFWDFEILGKIDTVLGIIKSCLGMNAKIPARKCRVARIDKKTAESFCDKHHLNGSTNFSFAVGLIYSDSLIGCMTLGRSRFGKKRDCLEIIRMCFIPGYQIIGGISKMISLVKNISNHDIISYQDGRLGFGTAYSSSGFKLVKELGPNYIYAKGKVVISRQRAMKHKLEKLLGERFDRNLTEKENMVKDGWLICYDAGHLLWEFKRS